MGFPDETIFNRSDKRLNANCSNHLLSGVRSSERLRIKNEKQISLGDSSENVDLFGNCQILIKRRKL